jgi:hypothetical protein
MPARAVFLFQVLAAFVLLSALSFAQSTPTVQERLGYPANARLLVIHADDFGMAHTVNRATIEALDKGWITSASILVPCPWFPEVVRYAKAHPDADLGIHLALNSEWNDFRWGPVSSKDKVPSLLDGQGYLPLDTPEVQKNAKMPEVETELRAQIDRAQALGIHLTHLDAHMGTAVSTPELLNVYLGLGQAVRGADGRRRDCSVRSGAGGPGAGDDARRGRRPLA